MSLRTFVEQFPPLKVALYVNDAICYVFSRFLDLVSLIVRSSCRLIYFVIKHSYEPIFKGVSWACNKLIDSIPPIRRWREARERAKYERLALKAAHHNDDSEPYFEDQLVKRAVTYHGALLLALIMYIFVYFVLIKHHTFASLSVAFVLMLIYLLVVENSHNIRSILMLCLPIMFTNRGRALVFCSMLALLASGPIWTLQHNIGEIHLSLYCCKQYLIVNTDEFVGDHVVSKLVKIEQIVVDLVDNIKTFAKDMREKFDTIINLAIEVELYISNTIDQLKRALKYCEHHKGEIYDKCGKWNLSCRVNGTIINSVCRLPIYVVQFYNHTIRRTLESYVDLVKHEFYVDVDVTRDYGYNITKSKAYSEVISEIQSDIDRKFWYIRLVSRVFNFVSLILVIWILLTATIYHMHYLRELSYDNMYLDELLDEAAHPQSIDLKPEHERRYLKPFSLHMNKVEVSKLYIAGLVWLIIVGYISFFVALDYSLYQLVDFIVETLREILFTSDLPLIDLETKSRGGGDKVVRYNRTYLSSLRKRLKQSQRATTKPKPLANLTGGNLTSSHFSEVPVNNTTRLYTTKGTHNHGTAINQTTIHNSSIQAFYDRLIASVAQDVPDDITILESLEGCLPKTHTPIYRIYRVLFYLALLTFGAVILEAYALRTRHCIANLYYPRRARRRARWLFRKITSEKPKYADMDDKSDSGRRPRLFGPTKPPSRRENDDEKSSRSVLEESSPDQLDLPKTVRSNRDDEDDNNLGYGFQSSE